MFLTYEEAILNVSNLDILTKTALNNGLQASGKMDHLNRTIGTLLDQRPAKNLRTHSQLPLREINVLSIKIN